MARRIEVEIIGNTAGLERAFGRTQTASGRLERSLRTLGRASLYAIGAGVGVGLVGVGLAAHSVNKEFELTERATAQTAAVLKSTGGVANVTAKQVDGLSTSLMKKSGIDDQVIQSGENMLLTFRNIRNEQGKGNMIFDRATRALLDMSVAMKGAGFEGGNIKTTAIRLGKALNDPIRGITALRRVGVQFTDSQTKMIKHLVETGHLMTAQKMILGELTAEFGGSARAAGKTLPGQLRILQEELKNTGVWVEAHFLPIFLKGVDQMRTFFGFIGKIAHAPNIKVGLDIAGTGLKDFGDRMKTSITNAIDSVDWKPIGQALGQAIGASIVFSANALDTLLGSMLSWVGAHSAQIAAVGVALGLQMVSTLTDPTFWAHHLDLLALVMLTAFGGSLGRFAGRFGAVLAGRLGPVFERGAGELALLFMRGVAKLPRLLGDAVAAAGTVGFRAMRGVWRAIVGETGRGVAAAGAEAGRLGAFLGRVFRLTAAVAVFRLGISAMVSAARTGGSAIASGIRSALSAAGRAAHAFAGTVTSAMHAVLGPIHAVINAIQTLWSWLSKVANFTIHIHIPTPHIPHISLPHIGLPGAAGGVVTGGMKGRDSVPAVLMPGEVVVPVPLVQSHGGPSALMEKLGFQRFARGGVAKKPKHHAPHLPGSIREAEAHAAGTPQLTDDIAAYGRELSWVDRQLGRKDLTATERESLKVRRIRLQNRLKSLRARQKKRVNTDVTPPASIRLAEAQARLTAPLDDDIAAEKLEIDWLKKELAKPGISTERRIALTNALADAQDTLKSLLDQQSQGGGGGAGGGDTGDLQARLDQALARLAVAQNIAAYDEAFVGTGIFGGAGGGAPSGAGGGGPALQGGPTIIFQHLIPDAQQIIRATGAIARGAGLQPYRSTSLQQTGY